MNNEGNDFLSQQNTEEPTAALAPEATSEETAKDTAEPKAAVTPKPSGKARSASKSKSANVTDASARKKKLADTTNETTEKTEAVATPESSGNATDIQENSAVPPAEDNPEDKWRLPDDLFAPKTEPIEECAEQTDDITEDNEAFGGEAENATEFIISEEIQNCDEQPPTEMQEAKAEDSDVSVSEPMAEEPADGDNISAEENGGEAPAIEQSETIAITEARQSEEAQHEESEANAESKPKRQKRVHLIFDFVELFVFTLAAVLIITSFFFRHSIVEGSSMDHTLANGDNLIISGFMYEPKAGDIVVVEYRSPILPESRIVKRVIALGGQTVRIEKYGIYVDGKRESYGSLTAVPANFNNIEYIENIFRPDNTPCGIELLSAYENFVHVRGEYCEFKVPKGEVFILGDHRDNSTDSRTFGCVPEETIVGKVLFRLYPFDKFGTVD